MKFSLLDTLNGLNIVYISQNNTMQMMYDVIYKALVEAGLDNEYEPQDYLNFFCLGNREAKDVGGTSDAGNHPSNSPQVNLLQIVDTIYRHTCVPHPPL